ncbi:MAG: chromophore lyase CpcT/CpeT [Oscillatoriales cyanobacterium C42_A2020_001]|nr:chromophore lyase CpcT/CpeT [Leptolyngbyaceae cyanobacterium C42_A2020_001]
MNRRNAIALLIGCFWLGSSRFANAQNLATPAMQQQSKEVAAWLEGVMDTTAQAKVNPKAPSVQMTTCRVNVDIPKLPGNPIFLYQEQALTSKLSQPYRQRFLEITPDFEAKAVRSLSFRPLQSDRWAGFCNKPESLRMLQKADLGSPVCSVFLKKVPNGYLGETPSEGCPANVRGAVRITNTIELNASGMNTWDRGFDANGKQVWGAQSEAYEFRRQQAGSKK